MFVLYNAASDTLSSHNHTVSPTSYKNADTLTGFLTAAEFPSLNLYATRYGFAFGPLFAPPPSLGTMGLPKKSTAT